MSLGLVPIIFYPEEFNRILILAKENAGPTGINAGVLADIAAGSTYHAHLPSHKDTITAAIGAKLLKMEKSRLRLTTKGSDFLALNKESTYELAPGQSRYLIDTLIVEGPYRSETKKLMRLATRNWKSKTIWIDPSRVALTDRQRDLIGLLRRLGFFAPKENFFEIVAEFVYMATSLSSQRPLTLAELEAMISQRQEMGSEAEQWVLEFERERLKVAGFPIEAAAVALISELDVCAGYDIESFDGESPALAPNRFIEVKSTATNQCTFFWSTNELATARRLDLSYWIYHLRNFGGRGQRLSILRAPSRLQRKGLLAMSPASYCVSFES
jgi:hypothetical protein